MQVVEMLGLDDVVENSFDANLVAPVDPALEFRGILLLLAVVVRQLVQDLYAPFYLSESWISMDPASKLTGISSMMPQKRNPCILAPLRQHASVIIRSAQSVTLLAHNIISSTSDVRETVATVVPLGRAHDFLVLLKRTLHVFVVDSGRSLAEVNREYSAMTNLAEFLVQRANVPFREAHESASFPTAMQPLRGYSPKIRAAFVEVMSTNCRGLTATRARAAAPRGRGQPQPRRRAPPPR